MLSVELTYIVFLWGFLLSSGHSVLCNSAKYPLFITLKYFDSVELTCILFIWAVLLKSWVNVQFITLTWTNMVPNILRLLNFSVNLTLDIDYSYYVYLSCFTWNLQTLCRV